MYKAFQLPVMEFPLPGEVPTASEESSHCQKKRKATAVKIALLLKSRRNCQSKSDDSYAKDSYEVPANAATTDTASDETELWAAILKTFGGNEATKKTKKNLLKQQYGNFKVEGSETLEQTFNRLQVIVGQLQFIDVEIEHDDLNHKFLTSLAPEWLMHMIVWRNRSDLDTMSLDDLYNHLKVYESEVQKKSKLNSQNMAFISSAKHSRGNEEVNTASISTASTNVPTASANIRVASISQDTACAYIASQSSGSQIKFEDINQIDEDDIEEMDIKWNMALLSMRADRFWKKTKKKISIQGSDVVGFDKSKVECFNYHKIGHFARECIAPRSQDRGRKDNFRQGSKIKEHAPNALSNSLKRPRQPSIESKIRQEQGEIRIQCCSSSSCSNLFSSQEGYVLDGLLEFKDDTVTNYSRPAPTVESSPDDAQNKNHSVTKTEASPSTISLKSFIKFVKANDSPTNSKTDKADTGKKPPVKYTEQYRKPKKKPNVRGNQRNWNNLKSHQLGPNFVMKKNACFNCGDFNHFAYDCRKKVKRETSRLRNTTHKSFSPRPAVHKPYRPPMRPMRSNMNGMKGKAVKPSACLFWKPLQHLSNKGPNSNSVSVMFKKYTYIDTQGRLNGYSRHMTGNISYLSDYEPFDGGYVSFGQRGCKITGKGIIKTGKLEFENVYFVKDLKYNLFSMSQIYDNVFLRTSRQHNMYSIDLNNIVPYKDLTCLVAKASADECMLWDRRLGHLNFKTMNKLVWHNLVRGLPTKCFENDHTCTAFLKEKQHKESCKSKLVNSVSKPLHTLHMVLFGPAFTFFLKTKDDISGILRKFITEIENLKDLKLKIIRCDNGGEFRNKEMIDFYSQKGIKREFSNARTPQQNGVAERRNMTLIKAARTMLADAKLPVTFWAEAVNTACYVQNRVLVNKSQNKTPYELFNGRTPAIGFLKPFGCHVMILNTLDNLGKFKAKGMKVTLLDTLCTNSTNLSSTKDAAIQELKKDVSSLRYITLPNWVHNALLESSLSKPQDDCSTDVPESIGNFNPTATSTNPRADQLETLAVETPIPTVSSTVPTACLNNSLEPSSDTRLVSKRVANQVETPSLDNILSLTNQFEDILGVTTNLVDSDGVEADVTDMETNITASPTPTLRIHKDHPRSQIIGPVDTLIQTRNKSKEVGEQSFIAIIHQKTDPSLLQFCLFSCFLSQKPKKISDALQDPSWVEAMQEEHLQFEIQNVWTLVDCPKGMDVKSAFLYGTIDEEMYVMQPPRFQDLEFPAKVYKVEKAMGTIDQTLFIIRQRGDFILVQVMDVRSSNTPMDEENPWGKDRTREDVDLHLYRSMIGSLMYLTASTPDIMFVVCACARNQVTPKECHLHAVKSIFRYLKGHPKLGLWYPKESPFDLVAYSDSDYGGATQDRKSTTGGCQFLGRRLISWQCKKQIIVATSTTEAEYVAAAICYGQVLLSMQCKALSKEISSSILRLRARIAQFLALSHVADEPASPLRDVSEGKACPTDSGFRADQDKANIDKTSTLPHDSAPRVTSPAANEGAQELKINMLKARVKLLEDRERRGVERSGDDAPIKGRNLDEGEAAAERVSDDTEEMETILTSMDAATVLASGVAEVSTGSGYIPTTGPPAAEVPTGSDVVPTAGLIFTSATVVTPYTRRKGKETMVESKTLKKKKVQEQIDAQVARELEEQMAREDQRMSEQVVRDAKIARIHAEKELQIMIDGLDRSNETVAKYLQEYHQFATELPLERRIELISDLIRYQDNYAKAYKFQTQQRKPWSKKQKRDYYMAVIKSNLGWKVKCSHWQYKFPLPVKDVATARRLEMPLPEVCTAIEEKKKKLPVKDKWQLH
nr:hypothetical protein [Tanacetum cinerariifolium]